MTYIIETDDDFAVIKDERGSAQFHVAARDSEGRQSLDDANFILAVLNGDDSAERQAGCTPGTWVVLEDDCMDPVDFDGTWYKIVPMDDRERLIAKFDDTEFENAQRVVEAARQVPGLTH